MKQGKELTMRDLIQSLIFIGAGLVIIAFWTQVDTLPHSGWIMLFGTALSLFGCIRYIWKYFRQPIKFDEQPNRKEDSQ